MVNGLFSPKTPTVRPSIGSQTVSQSSFGTKSLIFLPLSLKKEDGKMSSIMYHDLFIMYYFVSTMVDRTVLHFTRKEKKEQSFDLPFHCAEDTMI